MPAMKEPDKSDDGGSDEWSADEGVGNSAMMLEALDGTGKSPEYVDVSGFCGENGGERGVSGLAIQTGAADACSGEEMRNRFHKALGTIVAELAGWRVSGTPILRVAGLGRGAPYNPAHG